MWGCPPLIACAALFHDHGKEKRMKASQLTTIAALPMGGGCMSALPPEISEHPDQVLQEILRELPSPKINNVDEMAREMLARAQAGQ